MRALACLGLALLSGCERLLSIHDPVPGDAAIVVPPSSPILLSEVVLSPTGGEMIEIVNPSNQEVNLSTYYLSDSGNYYTLPVQPSVQMNDFIVKFPPGAKISANGVMTIAIDMPTNFATAYGKAPDFSVADGSMQTIVANGQSTLTNEGEPIILFQWDGRSDLVHDVDIMIVGNPAPGPANEFPNKSGLQQDGSDPDTMPSQYAVDRHTIRPQASAPGVGLSTKRILHESGHEVQDGTGNGQLGDDETSEDTSITWDTVFTAPTPGTSPLAPQ
jgi:hypothetical protein